MRTEPEIVERLRSYARNCSGPPEDYLTWQAADEIERLKERCNGIDSERLINLAEVERLTGQINDILAHDGCACEALCLPGLRADIERLHALLAEAIPYIDRARISHLGTDPIVAAHNERCLNFIGRARAALEPKP